MNKFTKGEWKVADGTLVGEQVLFVYVVDNKIVCRLTKVVNPEPLEDEDIANAHLIAAAPELYMALDGLYKAVEDIAGYHGIDLEAALSALTKADGVSDG